MRLSSIAHPVLTVVGSPLGMGAVPALKAQGCLRLGPPQPWPSGWEGDPVTKGLEVLGLREPVGNMEWPSLVCSLWGIMLFEVSRSLHNMLSWWIKV